MAETSGTLFASTRWTSQSPAIYISATYETQSRTATTVQARVKVSISSVSGSSYFGYNIQTRIAFPGLTTAWKTVKNNSPNQWSSALSYDSGWQTVSQAAASESFTARVCMDSSSGTRSAEYSGTIKIKKGNTAPYWPSGAAAQFHATSSALTVPENMASVAYSWTAAKDDQNDTIYYKVEWFKNGVSQGNWKNDVTSRSYTVAPNVIGEGQNMYFRVYCRDSMTSYSSYKQSNTLTRNKLTAAQITSVEAIRFDSASFSVARSNASNLNGNTDFTYSLSSSDIPVYNGANIGTSASIRIDIWREGTLPAGPYVIFSEIQNFVRNSSFTGTPTFTLSTKNSYGTTLSHSRAGSVNLQMAPSESEVTEVSGTFQIKGSAYYVINRKALTLRWSPATDPNRPDGSGISYTLQASVNAGAWTTAASGLAANSCEYPVRNISSSQTVKFRVAAVTTYGTTSVGPETESYTLHYYHAPSMSDLIIDRDIDRYTISWKYRQNSSIPRTLFQSVFHIHREGQEGPLETISMGDSGNGVEQYTVSANLSGLREDDTYPLFLTCYDEISKEVFSLEPENLHGIVPRYSALLTIREKGIGINAVAGDYAAFIAKGTTSIYGDTAKGGADGSIHLATHQGADINFYSGIYLDAAGILRAAQTLPAGQEVYQIQMTANNPPLRWRELYSETETVQDAVFVPSHTSDWNEGSGGGKTLSMDAMPVGFCMDWYKDTLPSDKWMFGGTAIPAGYTEARAVFGTATPNTAGRVVVDKSSDSEFQNVGQTGGAKTHKLTVAELAAHTHTQNSHTHSFSATSSSSGKHSHQGIRLSSGVNSSVGVNEVVRPTTYSGTACQVVADAAAHTHTVSGTSGGTTAANQNTGGNGAHNNLQPYIVARKIFKVL